MKRVLLKIAYDGTDYHGWQVQDNAVTVQQRLQDSLEELMGFRPDVTGCSRTDAGVHARGFCCHTNCPDNLPKEAFLRGLNSILPNDISVRDCTFVRNDFHARYDAMGKNYIYRFYVSQTHDPFTDRYAWRLEKPLNEEAVAAFCKTLIGTHDFKGFCASGSSVTDTVRTVSECELITDGGCPAISVSANGFLYNMVRIIVGTAYEVSEGRLSVDCANEIFSSAARDRAGITAPPNGLFLNQVFYSREDVCFGGI